MPTKVRCPNPTCQRVVVVPEHPLGRRMRCASCRTKLLAPLPAGYQAPRLLLSTRTASDLIGRYELRAALGEGTFGK
ncbi:MAG TPA: hypothetical protein PKD86_17305, partial [Gemmatales bacterium]|nr:hypothetical protein [Gemmatales bacterium]